MTSSKNSGCPSAIDRRPADVSLELSGGRQGRAALTLSRVLLREGNHAGFGRPDTEKMKFYFDKLPEDLQRIVSVSSRLTINLEKK